MSERLNHRQTRSLKARFLRCMLLIMIGAGSAVTALAAPRITSAEMSRLPPYCADSEAAPGYERGGPRYQYWVARMGGAFNAIHHYCYGLVEAMRVRSLPSGDQARRIGLRRAIMEFNYFIEGGVPMSFVLMPEILVKRAEAAVLLEDWLLAYDSYARARAIKPDYWPAYLQWAEVLVRINKRDDAKALLMEGLTHAPNQERMRQLYVQLGGSLQDIPEPVAAPASAPASAPGPAAAAASAEPAASAASK